MQYLIVTLTPFVLIFAVGAIVLLWTDWFPLILILTLNAGGAVGDLWMAGMIARKPVGTMFEDLKDGVRILEPTDQSESS